MRLILLSEEFYRDYAACEEVLQKQTRPYVCLAIKIYGNIFAIPFRHHIPHKYAFITYGRCGLDYTKAAIIAKRRYISNSVPQIEQKEFDAIKGQEEAIRRGMMKYVNLYKKALRFKDSSHYASILRFSSLRHFTDML